MDWESGDLESSSDSLIQSVSSSELQISKFLESYKTTIIIFVDRKTL